MKTIMVRYKTHPEHAEKNAALVRAVYEELRTQAPAGLRYATYLMPDGVSFVHLATHDNEPSLLTSLPAFKAFVEAIKERCVEPPVSSEVSVVGSYGHPPLAGNNP